jgi:hypothetical protein
LVVYEPTLLYAWADSRDLAMEHVRRRGHTAYDLIPLTAKFRIDPEWLKQPHSPRDYSVEKLRLWDTAQRLLGAGYLTLGALANMTLEEFRRLGFNPPDYRAIQGQLALHGLTMSFKLFPGERKAWSPKRRSA